MGEAVVPDGVAVEAAALILAMAGFCDGSPAVFAYRSLLAACDGMGLPREEVAASFARTMADPELSGRARRRADRMSREIEEMGFERRR